MQFAIIPSSREREKLALLYLLSRNIVNFFLTLLTNYDVILLFQYYLPLFFASMEMNRGR